MPSIFTLDFWMNTLYALPGILVGLSFHEWAHAYAAYKMGDPTAKNFGRMTVNPLAHFDPIGFISLLLLGFGWAKPVPINPRNYRHPRRDDIIVSLAGITMNLIIAIFGTLLLYLCLFTFKLKSTVLINMIYSLITINLALMIFNLIPIPPLDGSHVVETLLIRKVGPKPFLFLRKYGFIILIVLLLVLNMTNILSTVIGFFMNALFSFFNLIFGVVL
ncbi:MAG: site-2 protease family protein [Clostridia bacterium]